MASKEKELALSRAQQERVQSLLIDTVTLLCKNSITFQDELKVEGLLGITVDKEVFLVNINEKFTEEKDSDTEEATPQKTSNRREKRSHDASQSPVSTNRDRPDGITVKQEALQDDDDDEDLVIVKDEGVRERRVPPLHGASDDVDYNQFESAFPPYNQRNSGEPPAKQRRSMSKPAAAGSYQSGDSNDGMMMPDMDDSGGDDMSWQPQPGTSQAAANMGRPSVSEPRPGQVIPQDPGCFQCLADQCGHTFQSAADLERHLWFSHLKLEVLFACKVKGCDSLYYRERQDVMKHFHEDHWCDRTAALAKSTPVVEQQSGLHQEQVLLVFEDMTNTDQDVSNSNTVILVDKQDTGQSHSASIETAPDVFESATTDVQQAVTVVRQDMEANFDQNQWSFQILAEDDQAIQLSEGVIESAMKGAESTTDLYYDDVEEEFDNDEVEGGKKIEGEAAPRKKKGPTKGFQRNDASKVVIARGQLVAEDDTFPCPLCNVIVSKEIDVIKHFTMEHSCVEVGWECGHSMTKQGTEGKAMEMECGRLFIHRRDVRRHERQVHNATETGYAAPRIVAVSWDRDYRKSKPGVGHKSKPGVGLKASHASFECPICNLGGLTGVALEKHFSTHHPGSKVVFTCGVPGCSLPFTLKRSLGKHQRTAHHMDPKMGGPYTIDVAPDGPLVKQRRVSSRLTSYECPLCDFQTTNLQAFEDHCNVKHPEENIDIEGRPGEGMAKIECPKCDYYALKITAFKFHCLDKHPGVEFAFACSVEGCAQICQGHHEILRHERIFHSLVKEGATKIVITRDPAYDLPDENNSSSLVCPNCSRPFLTQEQLDEHIKVKHSDDKLYHCTHEEDCNKKYHLFSHLREHLIQHHGVNRYVKFERRKKEKLLEK